MAAAAVFDKTGYPQALAGGKPAAGEKPIFARGRALQDVLHPGWQTVPQERVLRSQEEGKHFGSDDQIAGRGPPPGSGDAGVGSR